jgi:predicted dehydrogenase
MGISLGLVGLGAFGSAFADLFKSHPLVDRIGLCDVEPDRIAKFADDPFYKDKFNPRDAYASLDEICKADFDALVIITQPWLHAPQCLQAMESGKHVYSAVPVISIPDDDEILEWCNKLINASRKTGLYYMLGETSFYRPNAMFCRKMAKAERFGNFVYAEGEYCHDVDNRCNLREVQHRRTASSTGRCHGETLRKYVEKGCRLGPMHYPTHSVCGPVCVMNAHAEKVTAYGYRNSNGDPFFADYAFSNEVALYRMSNGATVRIAEMRESPGMLGKDGEIFRVAGTKGTYSEDRWFEIKRPDFASIDLKNLPKPNMSVLTAKDMRDPLPLEVQEAFKKAMNKNVDAKDLQNLEFNPAGHGGSHPYLVHEFVDAVANRRQPAINIWEASRYMAMGVMAHKSALKDGETLKVPDWGDAHTYQAKEK